MNIQDWFPLGRTGWISLQSRGLSRVFNITSSTSQFKSINSSALSFLYSPTVTSVHDYWKTVALTRRTSVGKVMTLLSRLIIAFLPRTKLPFHFMAAITIYFGSPQNKVSHCFHCFPIYLPWSDRTRCHDLSFLMLSFRPTFSLSSFTFTNSSLVLLRLSCELFVTR